MLALACTRWLATAATPEIRPPMTDPPSAEKAETRAVSMTGLGLLCLQKSRAGLSR